MEPGQRVADRTVASGGGPADSMMRRGLLQLVPVVRTPVATASASPGP